MKSNQDGNPLIITCAITGAETEKSKQPALPITPKEQAAAALECYQAGATIIHLHVRDHNGKPTQDLHRFEETILAIREVCPVLIEISTGGAVGDSLHSRAAPLFQKNPKAQPNMGSLNMGTINFGNEIFTNSIPDIEFLTNEMRKAKVRPTYEVYDVGMLEYALKFCEKNPDLATPPFFNLVLGAGSGSSGSLENLLFLKNKIPTQYLWGAAGIGRFQLPIAVHTLQMGGHVRVGLEDNIFYSKGKLAKSNAELVARISRLALELDRPIAKVEETKRILGC